MAKKAINVKGLNETLATFSDLQNITGLAKAAIYEGAAVVADTMEKEIQSLKVSSFYGTEEKKRYCWKGEKECLVGALGIAKFMVEDKIHTKVGFDGYWTQEFDDHSAVVKAIPLIANSINAGTSFMYAQPFIDNTVKTCSKRVFKVMDNKITEGISKKNKS